MDDVGEVAVQEQANKSSAKTKNSNPMFTTKDGKIVFNDDIYQQLPESIKQKVRASSGLPSPQFENIDARGHNDDEEIKKW